MRRINGIYHYPIKGLSPQSLQSIELTANKPFPFDRIFALARPDSSIDAAQPSWRKKGWFVMLMLDEALAKVRTHLNVETLEFHITRDDQLLLNANLATDGGCHAVEQFFKALVPRLHASPRLLRANDGHFMDKPDNVVSLINLSTLRSLEEQWGYAIDPLRFRANFYMDGIHPWEEFDWIGSDIMLGNTLCRVDRRNGRCGATNVNPMTGQRDLDIPGSLRKSFGHKDLGVYLIVRKGGSVALGDTVNIEHVTQLQHAQSTSASVNSSTASVRRYICRGCYFIYDEARGLPQEAIAPGTAFTNLTPLWRCPDCGTDKSSFQLQT